MRRWRPAPAVFWSTTSRWRIRRKPCGGLVAARLIEISGGVTLDSLPDIASTGATYVSVGALTHSVRAADISFEVERL